MVLFLDSCTFEGQVFGVIFHGDYFFCFHFPTLTRNIFRTLVLEFERRDLSFMNIKKIYYLQGRGSFSTNRSLITIINILRRIQRISIIDMRKMFTNEDAQLYQKQVMIFLRNEEQKKKQVHERQYITPRYEFEPNITKSRRDF